MAKSVAAKKSFSFVGGLNTEGGPLVFPPNTWSEGDNVVPSIDGGLSKRYAMNFEAGYSLSTAGDPAVEEENGAFGTQEWNSVGGDGSLHFVVVQRSDTLYFYVNTGTVISTTAKTFTLPLLAYKAAGNPNTLGVAPVTCTSANGKLVVTSADTTPILVAYNSTADTISHAAIDVQIRDLYGVDDGLAVDNRPTTLSAAHQYNLYNQGWSLAHIDTYFALGPVAPATEAVYPSNSQSWVAGKDASDNFSATLLNKQDFGTSPAPRGRHVLSLFNRDRTTASGVPGITTETELYRPTTSAFYAGRAWYAGQRSTTAASWVLFSQVADTDDRYGNCYQDADPSSEIMSDLVDTDGGVIPIQEAGTIVALVPAHNSLFVFADNGVWQIKGSLDIGFSATSYEVSKLSSVGAVASESIVEAEQAIFYWAADGIWVIRTSKDTGSLEVISVTNTSIQTLYRAIPTAGRIYAVGDYFIDDKTIYWLYNDSVSQDGVVRRFKKNRLLCLDLRTNAFYTHLVSSLASLSPYPVDLIISKTKGSLSQVYNVVDSSAVLVEAGAGVQVTATLGLLVPRNTDIRFLACAPQSASSFKWTFAMFEAGVTQVSKYKEWYAHNTAGTTYESYILTGYDLGADTDREKGGDQGGATSMQALYLTAFLHRTETGIDSAGNAINPSSCNVVARWDWTDSNSAHKWSTSQEVYRHRRLFNVAAPSATYDDGYPIVVTKSKIRGRGKAIQLKFTAHATKDMKLAGWAITFIGNTNV